MLLTRDPKNSQANYPFRRIVVLTDEDVLMIYEKLKSLLDPEEKVYQAK